MKRFIETFAIKWERYMIYIITGMFPVCIFILIARGAMHAIMLTGHFLISKKGFLQIFCKMKKNIKLTTKYSLFGK